MRRTVGALCVLIVGLQILIGVPVLVCLVLFALLHGGLPMTVEVHAGHDAVSSGLIPPPLTPHEPMIARSLFVQPPANKIPQNDSLSEDNPILTSRAEQGSPLAGTVLGESVPAEVEQQLFVAALEKVAAEAAIDEVPSSANPLPCLTQSSPVSDCSTSQVEQADRLAIEHLYAMADSDERAAKYARADQWRALAREIRNSGQSAEPSTAPLETADSSAK